MPRQARTQIIITDVKANPSHVNEKGIQVEGIIIVGVKVKCGKYNWTKAYGFSDKQLKNFTLDAFKVRIYEESRVWLKEKQFEEQVLHALKDTKGEIIYLD